MTRPLTCTFDGCDALRETRWRCLDHWSTGRRLCTFEGCDRKHYGDGLCHFHWHRRRTGVDLAAPKFEPIRTCTFAGCYGDHHAHGLCTTHLARRDLWGDPAIRKARPVPPPKSGPDNPTWKGDKAGYHAVHWRLRTQRGRARDYTCSCGEPARQWAYDGMAPDEKTEQIKSGGRPVWASFSHDLSHYLPMCVRCHIAYDRRPRDADTERGQASIR